MTIMHGIDERNNFQIYTCHYKPTWCNLGDTDMDSKTAENVNLNSN